jgi:hypothetical protein
MADVDSEQEVVVTAVKKGHKSPPLFKKEWELQFGLQVSTRDPVTKTLLVWCAYSVTISDGRTMIMKIENESAPPMTSFIVHHGEPTTIIVIYGNNTFRNG